MQNENIARTPTGAQLGDILASPTKITTIQQTIAQPMQKAGLSATWADRQQAAVTVEYTIFEADPGRASPAKTFGVGPQGKPVVTISGQQPAAGRATRRRVAGTAGNALSTIATDLESLTARQTLICAPPPAGQDEWAIRTKEEAEGRTDAIARTKDRFLAPRDAALMGLDFDIKNWPPALVGRIDQAGGLSKAMSSVFAAIDHAAYLRRASSSVGVQNKEKGLRTDSNAGQHRFFIVRNGVDIQRFAKALHERLILAGFGYATVAKNGHILIRSLIDEAATADVSRLWFEGAVVLADARLELVPGARKATVYNTDCGLLDTAGLTSLSDQERRQLEMVVVKLRADVSQEAQHAREVYEESTVARLVKKGVSAETANSVVSSALDKRELIGPFEIYLDDSEVVTVDEILSNPTAYHRKTCADPHEPEYGSGRNLAIIFTDGKPHIFSQAHGGIEYQLWHSVGRWFDIFSDDPGLAPADGDWPDPIDLFADDDPADLANVPEGVLPAFIDRWVKSEARRKGVPEAFPAIAAMTAIGAAIGNSLKIRPRKHDSGWAEPASLWTVLVAEPGRAKSPTIKAAVAPLRALDFEMATRDQAAHDAWLAATKRKMKDAPDPGSEPKIRRAVIDQATLEKQIRIHADNPRGLLSTPDELVSLLGNLGAYKKSAEGDRGQMLRMFDGDAITVDRVGSGTITAKSALMGVISGTQPNKIRKLMTDLGDDGMLQRFIFVMDDGAKRQGVDEPPDHEAAREYASAIRTLATADYLFPGPISMSEGALEAFNYAMRHIDMLKDLSGISSAFKGHAEKWGRILPRLVLIFHAVEQWSIFGAVDPQQTVARDTALKAIGFARFLLRHSLHFYQQFSMASEEASEAYKFAGFLLTKPTLGKLSRRDAGNAQKALRDPRLLLATMKELEGAGWLAVAERDAKGPSLWIINPAVYSRFQARAEREKENRALKHMRIVEAGVVRKGWVNQDRLSEGGLD